MSFVEAAGPYSVARRHNDFVYTAGMTPRLDGVLTVVGQVGGSVAVSEARAAAALSTQRALASARQCLGDNHRLDSVLSLTVFISAAETFTALGEVADAASEVISAEFSDSPAPVRAAIGVSSLPGGSPVEVQLIATIAGLRSDPT